jgi:HAMP domain-containing protein
MDDRTRVLRLGIDGRWEAREFAQSLSALDRLYTVRFGLAVELEELRDMRDLYMEFPFPPFVRSSKHFRRWAKLLPPAFLRSELATQATGQKRLALWDELFEPQERLTVKRVIYGSPGVKDVAGIGEIIGHLKDLLVRIIELWSTGRQRNLENERRELENEQLQIQIAKDYVGLAREIGYSNREIRQLVASVVREQRPLIQLVAAGKVTSADTIDDEEKSS